jgi:transposase
MTTQSTCPNCQQLLAELERLRAQWEEAQAQLEEARKRIAVLEAEVRRGRRSAAPFSRDEPKPDPKPPGRRPGRGRFRYRSRPPEEAIQETVEVPLEACPACGGPLEDRATHEQVQVDIPEVRPVIPRFRTESGYCRRCRKRVRSRHPRQVSSATGAAGVSLGPRARALAADLKHRLGIPYRKVAELFRVAWGLEVTASGLCQADERLAEKAEPVYQELVEALRGSVAVHVDETGWRVGGQGAWWWVLTGPRGTVYIIDRRRSHEVVVEVLGPGFSGVWVTDGFRAYDHRALADWPQQKCFAHLLRELGRLQREKKRGAVRFPRELAGLLREALALREEKGRREPAEFEARLQELEAKLDARIAEKRRFTDRDNARLARRLRKQRRHLLRFLRVEGVEATNNRAERALRPAVLVRKTGGCNKTPRGARTHAVLASLLQTLRQQGRETLTYLISVRTAPARLPPLFPPPLWDTS